MNVVAPGSIWTPLIPSTLGAGEARDFGKQTPMGRAGQLAELPPVYVLLASPEASYVTGMVYGASPEAWSPPERHGATRNFSRVKLPFEERI